MANEESHWEEEQKFHKVFYNMAEKVDKMFSEYEKALGDEKKDVDDNRSTNHEGGGEDTPPSPSSSDSSLLLLIILADVIDIHLRNRSLNWM